MNLEKKCIVCGKNCGKPTLLDLFSGAGGAAFGYKMAGFCVLGIDINPQPRYAGCRFIQSDALTCPLDGFDVIHASPPCQAYSICTPVHCKQNHPKMIEGIRDRLKRSGVPYVIENVSGAREHLNCPIMLCGSMFGLPIQRHRYFEVHPQIMPLSPACNHTTNIIYITGTPRPKYGQRRDPPAHVKRKAMGTPWMTIKNMDEAIPPAYTCYIGKILIKELLCNIK